MCADLLGQDVVRFLTVWLGAIVAFGVVALLFAAAVVSFIDRRRKRSLRHYEARLRRQSAPRYECEDCIGMREHGCYCQTMGAREPGGPL
jgi:hypothetical protein